MRDFKFKAIYLDTKTVFDTKMLMEHEHLEDFFDGVKESAGDIGTKWSPLLQYTGFKDKDGVDIYEGDIFFEWEDGLYRWIVQWNTELGRWELREPAIAEIFYEEDMLATIENGELKGNFHEHPHLLENSK